jgi:hypothetical protein
MPIGGNLQEKRSGDSPSYLPQVAHDRRWGLAEDQCEEHHHVQVIAIPQDACELPVL